MKYLTLNTKTLGNMDGLDKMSYTAIQSGQPKFTEYPEWCGYALGGNKLYCDESVPNNHIKINE